MTDYIEIVSRPKPTAIQRMARDAKKINLLPHAVYSDGRGLPDCQTIAEVRDWLCRGYDKFHEKVAAGSQQFRLSEETREKCLTLLLDNGATSTFTLNDRDLMARAFDVMFPHFIGYVNSNPENEVASVNVICGSDGSSLDRPDSRLATSQEQVRKLLSKMARNWFAMTEFGMFNSLTHASGGRHLQGTRTLSYGRLGRMPKLTRSRRSTRVPLNLTSLERRVSV